MGSVEGMRLFIDTGDIAEVEEIAAWGVLSGATTNPSLLAKAEGDPGDIIRRICELVDGPTSAEVVSDDAKGMVVEGRALRTLHEHIVVKVPFSQGRPRGHPRAVRRRPPGQHDARLHGQPGAADRRGRRDLHLVLHGPPRRHLGRLGRPSSREIVETLRPGRLRAAQVLAASLRNPEHLKTAARLGCEVATVPAKVLRQALDHPLTTSGIEKFTADWETRPEFATWLKELTSSVQVAGR